MIRFLRKEGDLLNLGLLLFFLLAITSCNKKFDDYWGVGSPKGGYLYDKLKKTPEFTMFAEALDRANVAQFISNGGSFTVFAPTNEAFSKYLAARGYSSVNDVPVDELYKIVNYHIAVNMWYYYNLRDRYFNPSNLRYSQDKRYLTRSKKFVNIDVSVENSFKVDGIDVIKSLQDIDSDNGVIHGIGEVLIPKPNLQELMEADPEISSSTFYKLLKVLKGKVYDAQFSFDRDRDGKIDSVFNTTYDLLNGGNKIAVEYTAVGSTVINWQGGIPAYTTILVPANATLDQAIAPALAKVGNAIDSLSPSYVEGLLENYILQDTLMTAAQIKGRTGTLRTSNGDALAATALKNDADFIQKDIMASNGYIHKVTYAAPLSDRQKGAFWQATIEPQFKLYFAAIQKAGLMNTYGVSNRSASYFIPTNTALQAAGLNVVKMQLNGRTLSSTQFSNLVKHQIINATVAKDALKGTTRTAESGGSLTFSADANTVTNTNGSSATIGGVLYGSGTTGYVYSSSNLLVPLF